MRAISSRGMPFVSGSNCSGLLAPGSSDDKIRLREAHEVCANNSHASDYNEHEIKAPANICKSCGCSLKIHKIRKSYCRHTKTDTFSANVIREEFRVEDYTGDVDTHAVDREKEVKPNPKSVYIQK